MRGRSCVFVCVSVCVCGMCGVLRAAGVASLPRWCGRRKRRGGGCVEVAGGGEAMARLRLSLCCCCRGLSCRPGGNVAACGKVGLMWLSFGATLYMVAPMGDCGPLPLGRSPLSSRTPALMGGGDAPPLV